MSEPAIGNLLQIFQFRTWPGFPLCNDSWGKAGVKRKESKAKADAPKIDSIIIIVLFVMQQNTNLHVTTPIPVYISFQGQW
jgi:hypothetical protein